VQEQVCGHETLKNRLCRIHFIGVWN